MNEVFLKIRRKGLLLFLKDVLLTLTEHLLLFVFHNYLKLIYRFRGSDMYREYDGTKFSFSNSGDKQELLYHSRWNRYFTEEANKIKKYLHPGTVIIDVGANLGFFALLVDNLTSGNCIIHCFEPTRKTFQRLQRNIVLNNKTNIVLHNVGCGSVTSEVTIVIDEEYSGMSSIVLPVGDRSSGEQIQIVRLDDYLPELTSTIDFIKIDTEGFEPEVLRGVLEILKIHKPLVYIELGGGRFWESSCAATALLKLAGYTIPITEEELKTIPPGVNFLCFPTDGK